MKKIVSILILLVSFSLTQAQTPLTEAVDFTAKSIHRETIHLFEYLEDDKLVVVDFFSTSYIDDVIDNARISLYPNPASSQVNINAYLHASVVADIKIFDFLGKEARVFNDQYLQKGENLISLNPQDLTPGPYFVGIVSNSRLLHTNRLIISE